MHISFVSRMKFMNTFKDPLNNLNCLPKINLKFFCLRGSKSSLETKECAHVALTQQKANSRKFIFSLCINVKIINQKKRTRAREREKELNS